MPADCGRSLDAEKQFLNQLGTGKWSGSTRKSREDLLITYIKITPQRKELWVPKAVKHAKALLALEMK